MATKHINRYGRCLNENCEVCKSNAILEIPPRKEFVCPECGKTLKECAAPRQKSKLPIFIIAGIVVAIGVVVGIVMMTGNNKNDGGNKDPNPTGGVTVDSVKPDAEKEPFSDSLSAKKDEPELNAQENEPKEGKEEKQPTPEAEVKTKASSSSPSPSISQSSGVHSLGYATWKGKLKNGKPHGTGTMTYTTSRLIEERDPKKRMASPGEYIIGEWENGHLVQGRWYKSDNNKEQINIGRAG